MLDLLDLVDETNRLAHEAGLELRERQALLTILGSLLASQAGTRDAVLGEIRAVLAGDRARLFELGMQLEREATDRARAIAARSRERAEQRRKLKKPRKTDGAPEGRWDLEE